MGKVALLVTYLLAVDRSASLLAGDSVFSYPQHYSRSEVHRLVKTAKDASEFENLATYFRFQELLYRVKAQDKMDDFANCARKVTLAPKFQIRADSDQELFEYYSLKADHSSRMAERYERMLLSRGLTSVRSVRPVVSLNSLERESNKGQRTKTDSFNSAR